MDLSDESYDALRHRINALETVVETLSGSVNDLRAILQDVRNKSHALNERLSQIESNSVLWPKRR